MSLEAQSLTLEFISPEFKISGKTWTVNSGEKLLIPVEFHPPKEQTQYRGEARFRHNREKTIVGLTGTGASAHVVADDTIDFGSVKLGSVSQHNLRIANRGLLDCRFILDIVQNGNDFSFTDDEPYEYEGVIVSGTAEMRKYQYVGRKSRRKLAAYTNPLLVQTGLPVFRLTSIELDFKTTYINVNKTLEFTVVNDGNASCYWALESCPSLLHVILKQVLFLLEEPAFVEVEFVPVDFEQLVAELAFYTDAGRKTLMCYGLVGIPYLMIPQEHLKLEYGITAVDKAQAKTITMSNTGPRPITYEIVIANMLQDGVETGSEFEIFFVQPANGTILPGSTQNVVIRAIPKNYGTTITAKYIISTMDGERYVGNAKVTGGRAIIKIAPPVLLTEDGSVENKTAEISEEDAKSLAQSKNTALFEMTRLAFQAHIENLRDVLSGLRTEDIEMLEAASASLKSQHKIAAKPVTGRSSKVVSPTKSVEANSSDIRHVSKKKRDLQMLQKAEGQLQERIGSEESKRKFSSGTVFDGSDLRAKVNRALELAHSRGYNRDLSGRRPRTEPTASGTVSSGLNTTPSTPTSLDSSESRSEKFLNDLASLESELEVLSAVVKSVAGSTTESMTSTPSSGSSLSRYHAGSRKKNRQPKRNSRAAGNAGHKKTGKKKVKRTKDTQPVYDEDGNLVSHGVDESEYDSDMSESLVPSTDSKSGNSNDNSKPADSDTNAAVKSSGRISNSSNNTIHENEGDPFNPEDAVTTSSGTLGTDLTSPLEDLVRLAHFYTTLVNTDGEPELQRELVDEINAQLLASTKGVIKLVKEQLANSWVPNREFLSAALRQVQQSNHVMEALKSTKPSKGGPVVNDFNLGLVRSGDLLADVKLFNLPNMGNLSLDFVVKVNDK
ncbi:hypothetical protein BCR33DRAFT_787870 [Rhizoclosmatium globosum]|uniref:MSP domain-containing protein n=1 Tax=Rhizoclosmatium globosum TaxID=329046 RepID=A0A1Y2BYQ7_9FUNG|nr:hypothetical protein BCR33DRAFT_787870 [Rhizoclosmatium globosum]|eukprot:ORY39900.1 hypothetical protein BCR33DRAFT_787870 [Rhizoclosmatium globosum]